MAFAGIEFAPVEATDARAWWEAALGPAGRPVLARLVENVPFSEAFLHAGSLIDRQDEPFPTTEGSLAVVILDATAAVVVAVVRDDAGFELPVDSSRAASLKPDDEVSLVVIYPRRGEPVLRSNLDDLRTAAEQLEVLAGVLDHLVIDNTGTTAHGSLDVPCLRVDGDLPIVLGAGLTELLSLDRQRREDADPWCCLPSEQCLPPGIATNAGDQYTLAALWHWARCGRPPVTGESATDVTRKKIADEPPMIALEGPEGDVIRRAVAGNPDERFGSISEWAAGLGAAVAGPSLSQPAAVSPPAEPRPLTRRTTVGNEPGQLLPEAAASKPSAAASKPAARQRPAAPPSRMSPEKNWDVDTVPTVGFTGSKTASGEPPAAAAPPPQPSVVEPPTAGPVASNPAAAREQRPAAKAVSTASYPYRPGDEILPNYRLEKKLGQGGFGEVWQATAPGGMGVAIKVITNLGRQQGSREYRALQTVRNIRHPNIVPLFGVWLKAADGRLLDGPEVETISQRLLAASPGLRETTDSTVKEPLTSLELVVAMGLGDETLHDVLSRQASQGEPGVPLEQLLVWFKQTALAIDFFNRGQRPDSTMPVAVQHCDVKPQNMLLVGGMVQVCDFGLAREQGEVRATANNLASMAYAAPEMLNRPYDPSPTTDQYSLAISYVELRTGQLPYHDQTALDVLKAKLSGELDLSLIPVGERRVLERALALEPEARWSSCVEFIDALAVAAERHLAEPVADEGRAANEPHSQRSRPVSWGAIAGVTAALMAVAAGVVFLRLPHRLALLPEGWRSPASDWSTTDALPTSPSLGEAVAAAEHAAAEGKQREAIVILATALAAADSDAAAADLAAARGNLFTVLAAWADAGSATEAVGFLAQIEPAATATDLLNVARIYRADVQFDREAAALAEAALLDPAAVRDSGMVGQLVERVPAEAAAAHEQLLRSAASQEILDVFAVPLAESILANVRQALATMREIDAEALVKLRDRVAEAVELGHAPAIPLLASINAAIDLDRSLRALATTPPASMDENTDQLSQLEGWQESWPSHAKLLPESFTSGLSRRLADARAAREASVGTMRQTKARRQALQLVRRAQDRLDGIPLTADLATLQAGAKASEADCLEALGAADADWPEAWRAYSELGRAENFQQKFAESEQHLTRAIELLSSNPDPGLTAEPLQTAHGRRGFARAELHRWQEAATDHAVQYRDSPEDLVQLLWHFQEQAVSDPAANPPPGVSQAIAILEQLDQILTKVGKPAIAGISHWEVQTTLAWWLACGSTATLQTGRKAVPLARQALAACGPDPGVRANVLDTLAAAQARAGEFPAAVKSIDEAIEINPGLTSDLQPRRARYAAGEPWTDQPSSP